MVSTEQHLRKILSLASDTALINVSREIDRMVATSGVILCLTILAPSILGFECEKTEKHCFTSLNIGYAYTMVSAKYGQLFPSDRKLYYHNKSTNGFDLLPADDLVTSADGFNKTRKLMVANGTMPGPPIVIFANQKITVVVTNNLFNEGVTIHWHGIDQLGWPFMDGVSMVTQCPIAPGQTFNYTFQPTFGGTYWYHSHVGNQRDYGLFGAFIVLRQEDTLADVGHVLMLGEWNHNHGSTTKMTANINTSPQSVLINGKAEFNNNEAPLETITIDTGMETAVRFRLIAIGSASTLLFSIAGHELEVTETDGYRIVPTVVDQIIIYPAERYDFLLNVTGEQGVFNMTATILEDINLKESKIFGTAFLNLSTENPVVSSTFPQEKIRVLNCPLPSLPNRNDTECIPVANLQARDESVDDTKFTAREYLFQGIRKNQTFFLNFGFPYPGAAINGRRFKWPDVSAASQPDELLTCNDQDCTDGCYCSNSINLNQGTNVTMVFLNLGNGSFIPHPIHMHGHTYKVLKMGLPSVDQEGNIIANEDIKCSDDEPNNVSVCANATWRDPTWYDYIPGANYDDPVRKDTVVVPYGGYVVTRINADNPGVWFMHCHIDKHMIDGMALMINESFTDFNMSKGYTVPHDFPRCHDYHNTDDDTTVGLAFTAEQQRSSDTNTLSIVLGVLLGAVVLVLLAVVIIIICRRRGSGSLDEPRDIQMTERT